MIPLNMNKYLEWSNQLTNNSHIGILVVDKERNNLFVNDRLCEMFGRSKEELLSTNAEIFHVNHDTFLSFAQLAFDAVLKGSSLGVDYQFRHKDETLFWVHISGDPVEGATEVLWTMVDITPRVLINKELNSLKERMELALLGNNDGIWDLNLKTNEVYYSPRWKEMLGYKDNELKNLVSTWEDLVHPDDLKMVWDGLQDHIDGKTEYYEDVHRLRHKDGHWVWIRDRAKATYDENSVAIRMSGTHTDISKEKYIELKYTQQLQMIEQIHDCVISTDLKGIITSFNHGSEILLEYKSDEIIGSHITTIHLKNDFEKVSKSIEILTKDGEFNGEVFLVKK